MRSKPGDRESKTVFIFIRVCMYAVHSGATERRIESSQPASGYFSTICCVRSTSSSVSVPPFCALTVPSRPPSKLLHLPGHTALSLPSFPLDCSPMFHVGRTFPSRSCVIPPCVDDAPLVWNVSSSCLCCDHGEPCAFAHVLTAYYMNGAVLTPLCVLSWNVCVVFADELDGKDASGPDSFYKVYEPVFERNKRFAVILPAPSLGNDDTPIDEVRNVIVGLGLFFAIPGHVFFHVFLHVPLGAPLDSLVPSLLPCSHATMVFNDGRRLQQRNFNSKHVLHTCRDSCDADVSKAWASEETKTKANTKTCISLARR